MQELRSIFRRALIFSLFLLILFPAAQAQATIVGYTSRVAFDAAVPSAVVEGWDSYTGWNPKTNTKGDIIANGATVNGITYNYVPATTNPRSNVNFLVAYIYRDTTDDNTLALTGNGDPTNPVNPNYFTNDGIQFVFSSPTRAFGIDISTYAPTGGTFQATTNRGDVALSVFDPFPYYLENPTGQFVGFTSDVGISSVTITYNPNGNIRDQAGSYYGWSLDTMRTPLPPSLLLLGSGLAGLGLWRGRKLFKKA